MLGACSCTCRSFLGLLHTRCFCVGNLLQSFLGNDDQEGQGESAASEKDWPDDSTVDVD